MGCQYLGWNGLDANRSVTFEDDFVSLGVAPEVKVLVVSPGTVDVSVGRVGAAAGVTADISPSEALSPICRTLTG